MRAKLAKGDRTPPSGYEIPRPTHYFRDSNGVLHSYQHQGSTNTAVRFWYQGHSGSGTAVGGGAP